MCSQESGLVQPEASVYGYEMPKGMCQLWVNVAVEIEYHTIKHGSRCSHFWRV